MMDGKPSRPRRILIVDDDTEFAESLSDILIPHGYAVAVADRPEAALAELRRTRPEVALLDIRLRLSSGVDLLSRLTSECPGLVCVMMTAHAETRTAIEALRKGAYDYIDKGGEPNELHAVLVRCFEKLQLQEETRAAYEALRLAKEEAETASRSKSDFLANMSHELRTPLNAIIGFTEILSAEIFGPLGNARYLSYVGDIRASGRHLLELVNDVLDISKVECGQLDLVEETVDIAAVVDLCLRLVRERAESAGVTLDSALVSPLPPLRADGRRLKQVVLNLLSNAVKFTPPGGRVGLRVAANEQGVRLVVEDTGIGIAPADLATALRPFGQIDSRLARRYSGTGLGLPLAKAIVELHGGDLQIDSAIGRGTKVTVILPAKRLGQGSAAPGCA
jgi:signal transduction histidine kinase